MKYFKFCLLNKAKKYHMLSSIPWFVIVVVVFKRFDVETGLVVTGRIVVVATKEMKNLNKLHYEIDNFTL